MSEVALVYTHGETVKAVFMSALIQNVLLDTESSRLIGAVHGQPGAIIARARNSAAEWFLESTTLPWLLFVDADMRLASYTLPDMLAVCRSPCVASAATHGLVPDGPKLTWGRVAEGGFAFLVEAEDRVTGIDVCGMACTLIHRDVLLAVREAYADDPWPWFGHDVERGVRLGEDFTFCRRASRLGFPIVGVDTPVSHFKLLPI